MSGKLAVLIALLVAATACGSNTEDGAGRSEAISHVHGVGAGTDGEIYAATHTGLFVHDGEGWSQRSEDSDDHMGFSLTPAGMWRSGHPSDGGSLGVQRSADGGRTWEDLNPVSQPPVDFHAMTATATAPASLFGWDSGGRGLFRSADAGATWQRAEGDGLPNPLGALTAADGNTVYATAAGGLFRSDDAAATWQRVSTEPLFALAVAGGPQTLYAGRAQQDGLVRSTDGGTTWQPLEVGIGPAVAIAASGDGTTVVAADADAGVWTSTDAGTTWTQLRAA